MTAPNPTTAAKAIGLTPLSEARAEPLLTPARFDRRACIDFVIHLNHFSIMLRAHRRDAQDRTQAARPRCFPALPAKFDEPRSATPATPPLTDHSFAAWP